jgi:hypothetical protein
MRGNVANPLGPPQKFRLNGAACPSQEFEIGPNQQPWPAPVAVTDPPSLDDLRRRPRMGPPGGKDGRPGGPGPGGPRPGASTASGGRLPGGPPGAQ